MAEKTLTARDVTTLVGSLVALGVLVIVVSAVATAPSTLTGPPTGIEVFYLVRNPELLAPGLLFVSTMTLICYAYVAHW